MMTLLDTYLLGLASMTFVAVLAWGYSAASGSVNIVDSIWSLFFLIGGIVYASVAPGTGGRIFLMLSLLALWSLRLSAYISWRNWGKEEDHRYAAIRARNQPNFVLKSLYLIFLLQAALAWFISQPLLVALTATAPLGPLDALGAAVVIVGVLFEAVGDYQLARFKSDPANKGRVLDSGLWRYTRHPNYFGDFCVWWGFWLIAASAGGWWTVLAPVLMSFLLLRVSGVSLLEKDITDRRPAYADYIRRTNAFFPGPPAERGSATDLYQEG